MSDDLLERQTRLINDLMSKVNYYIQEYNFSYAEVVGLLDAVKTRFLNNWINESDEDEPQ